MAFEKYPEATATLDGSTALEISDGKVTLDSGVAPYCLADVTIPLLDSTLAEDLDPYANQRVTVAASVLEDGSDEREFDLVMTSRRVSHDGKEITLELGSDEALLIRYADVTDSIDAFAVQSSLRAVINQVLAEAIPGAALQPGTLDADVTTYTDATNLLKNPGTEQTTPYGTYTAVGCSMDFNHPLWSISYDGDSFSLWNPTAADSYMTVEGATGTLFSGLTPGKTYVFSGTGNVEIATSGSLGADSADAGGQPNKSRTRALVVHTRVGTGSYGIWHSPQVPNTPNTPTRVSVEFTVPEGATEVFLRAYLGATTGAIRWDGFRLSEKDPRPGVDNTSFFSGDTPDTAAYLYEWTGPTDGSISRRIALIDRAPELLIWEAGISAWDFLTPIVNTSGYRLFCDEKRRWWLIDPTDYRQPGRVVAQVSNTSKGDDTIDSSSGLYATGVVLIYTWKDSQNVEQTARDTAGSGPFVVRQELNRPYPGPGRAAAMLTKLQGQGRTQDVTIGSDYSVTPAMEVAISLPGTYYQLGTLQSVRWHLREGVMDIGSRGLVETPPGAINLLTGTIDSLTGTINSL